MKKILCIAIAILMFGIAGQMDYEDEVRVCQEGKAYYMASECPR